MRLSNQRDWNNSNGGGAHSNAHFPVTAGTRFAGPIEDSSRRRKSIVIAVASLWMVLFGAIAFVSLNKSNAVEKASASAIPLERPIQTEMIEVILPVRDVGADQQLDPSMFTRVWRPKAGLNDDVVRSFEELRGKFARASLKAQMPISRSAVSEEKPLNEVIANIPDGFRAVSINVNATTGVEGWARPGAHVDVHWITDTGGKRASRVLVQNAKVLSAERRVDPKAEPNAPAPTTVTLLVVERDAQKVSLAQTVGSLVLHLRGANDIKASSMTGSLTIDDLLGHEQDPRGAVEGVARVKKSDGTFEEFSIVNGRVVTEKKLE